MNEKIKPTIPALIISLLRLTWVINRIHRDSHEHPTFVVFGLLAVSNQHQLEC